jgi:hypothetical protein
MYSKISNSYGNNNNNNNSSSDDDVNTFDELGE